MVVVVSVVVVAVVVVDGNLLCTKTTKTNKNNNKGSRPDKSSGIVRYGGGSRSRYSNGNNCKSNHRPSRALLVYKSIVKLTRNHSRLYYPFNAFRRDY